MKLTNIYYALDAVLDDSSSHHYHHKDSVCLQFSFYVPGTVLSILYVLTHLIIITKL